MDRWLGAALLAVGVTGALGWPRRLPTWVLPVAAALLDMVLGVISTAGAWAALKVLSSPVGFLACAVPMSVMLDQLGLFEAVARRAPGRRTAEGAGDRQAGGAGYLWALAALVTTLLNLDAAVVLLTPLYVSIARQRQWDPLTLGAQPVLLACLASSALPVSNLTNLIAASWTGTGTAQFVAHLGAPSLVATVVGWWAYRHSVNAGAGAPLVAGAPARVEAPAAAGPPPASSPTGRRASPALPMWTGGGAWSPAQRRRLLWAGAVVVLGVLVGFTLGYLVGAQPWAVALAADAVLTFVIGHSQKWRYKAGTFPWRSVPAETAVVVLSLGVLALGVARRVPLGAILHGGSSLDMARDGGIAAVAANTVNNLPALLVGLGKLGHHPSPAMWAVLTGVNMGPIFVVTGSLASLLWLATMRRLGVDVKASDFTRWGLRVGLPAAAAGLGVLVLMAALGLS